MSDKIKIYLCGPIAGCSDSEAHDWRDWVKEQVEDHHEVVPFGTEAGTERAKGSYSKFTRGWAKCLDPMRRDYRGVSQSERSGSYAANGEKETMPWWVVKEIVELDKIDITRCDVVLANMLPDKTKTGSNMEIIYAWMLGKLVVIVHDPNKPISPWHRYHAQKIVPTLEEALDYIKNGNWNEENIFGKPKAAA